MRGALSRDSLTVPAKCPCLVYTNIGEVGDMLVRGPILCVRYISRLECLGQIWY
jgi:hypothetical protein